MSSRFRVGFVGLGDQGAPIARRIVEAGYQTTLWARRPESLAAFADTAAHPAATLAEMAGRSDVVGVCVYADADVEQVVAGEGGLLSAMPPGGIVLIHSTAHPDLCRRLTEAGAARGIPVLDAPVSGGNARAAAGQLVVMVGGDQAAFERVRPLLETFATAVEWLGPAGSGQICKLANNAVTTINAAAALAYVNGAGRLGLDRAALVRMLTAGSAQSFALHTMSLASTENLRFAEARLRKDVDLMLGVLRGEGEEAAGSADLTRLALDVLAHFARPPR
jgi:3-hydroxyisobutyrate dehydrogenase-like beta-hydroxyacid dehydrogenase